MYNEIIKAISDLNSQFFSEETNEFQGFEYRTNGFIEIVYFMGEMIWRSDDDCRMFSVDERGNVTFESFENFFHRQAKIIIEVLSKAVV